MNILGISAFYHDSAACLVRDGEILAAASEERFSRIKHDQGFPSLATAFCLSKAGISGKDLDLVAFYEKPFLKFERLLETYLAQAPAGARSFITAMPLWMKRKLWIKDLIRKETGFSGDMIFPEHHEAHAASAFYPSPFREAAVLTLDGVGEWATAAYGAGSGKDIRLLAEIKFPHSLGLLYSAFTYYTGFKVNSAEYKVMGLAPYGEPRYKDLILSELIDLKPDGSFRMNMAFFNYLSGLTMTSRRFHSLFGGLPRRPGSELSQRDMDLARSIQEVTEEIILRMARHVRNETGLGRLCLGGGVALNCVANGRLVRESVFDEIWVQPASGDAGGSIGAALCAWHRHLGKARTADGKQDGMKGAFLGPEHSNAEIQACLEASGVPIRRLENAEIPQVAADLIARGKIVGWFQGRMEFGPRALGARSILGDPRSPEMQSRMNLKIKFRESFRPFAPSILEEEAAGYFETARPSPYMLFVTPLRADRRRPLLPEEERLAGLDKLKALRSEIPAVTHVDYSARLHTVSREANPLFRALIEKFHRATGCPVLVNTSFNVRGEPIVCDPADALRCFLNTDMDCLVMGNFLVDKRDLPPRLAPAVSGKPAHSGWRRELAKLDVSRRPLQNFGLLAMAGLAALGALSLRRAPGCFVPALLAAALSGTIAILNPGLLRPLYRGWMAFALLAGRVMTALFLGAFFYLFLTPFAVTLRAFGKRFLDLDWPARGGTFWIRRSEKELRPEDLKNQF